MSSSVWTSAKASTTPLPWTGPERSSSKGLPNDELRLREILASLLRLSHLYAHDGVSLRCLLALIPLDTFVGAIAGAGDSHDAGNDEPHLFRVDLVLDLGRFLAHLECLEVRLRLGLRDLRRGAQRLLARQDVLAHLREPFGRGVENFGDAGGEVRRLPEPVRESAVSIVVDLLNPELLALWREAVRTRFAVEEPLVLQQIIDLHSGRTDLLADASCG